MIHSTSNKMTNQCAFPSALPTSVPWGGRLMGSAGPPLPSACLHKIMRNQPSR